MDDVRLGNSPLAHVICQVRFPAIAAIVQEVPGGFQGRIRKQFPRLAFQQEVSFTFPQGGPPETAVGEQLQHVFEFESSSKKTSVTLGINFCALQTTEYTIWPDFRDQIEMLLDVL